MARPKAATDVNKFVGVGGKRARLKALDAGAENNNESSQKRISALKEEKKSNISPNY